MRLFSLIFILIAALPALAKVDETKIKAAVEDGYREWLAAANKRSVEEMTSLYDENAVLMPKQEEAVIGKAAIGEYYTTLFANPQFVPFTLTFRSTSFHVAGDIAIDTIDFDGVVTRAGKDIGFRGKAMLVCRKQKNGGWKIFRYMYDEIPAKKAPAPSH